MAVIDLIPQEVEGWRQAPGVRIFNRQTIFDYIDGAGEVYRLYDFRYVHVGEFRKTGAEPVVVEVFDMGSAGDAYGIFTFYHEGQEVEIGQDAYLRPGLLSFWQDRYFVCVSTSPEGEQTDQVLQKIAESVARAIPRRGSPPAWLERFPARSRRPQSVRYFHNQASLNYHLFLSEDNIFKLDDKTECALARYGTGERSFHQFWVRYPDSLAAQAALKSVIHHCLPAGAVSGVAQDGNHRWTAITTHGWFVAAAFGVASRAEADSVRQAAEAILREVTK
jgi:hypothetical protein